MPDIVESFEEVDRSKKHPRARSGFVKSIRNGLRKIKNLSRVDRPGRKPAWRGERMKLNSRKKSGRNSMKRSKDFDTQEVIETGRKKAGELRGFPIIWIGIIEDVFQMKGKEFKVLERLKM